MTIAERYNTEAARLLPDMAARLEFDPAITSANDLDEIVFRRSEYLGGMIAFTTIRIDYAALPDPMNPKDRDAAARMIHTALRDEGISAEASDVLSHIKNEVPTTQLAAASTVLASMQLI